MKYKDWFLEVVSSAKAATCTVCICMLRNHVRNDKLVRGSYFILDLYRGMKNVIGLNSFWKLA